MREFISWFLLPVALAIGAGIGAALLFSDFAGACELVPLPIAGATYETYHGADLEKLKKLEGFPDQEADEVTVVLGPQQDGRGHTLGMIYVVKKGCIVARGPANDSGVGYVAGMAHIERKKMPYNG